MYLCHRVDYHWYVGCVQGGQGKIGKNKLYISISQIILGLLPAAYLDVIASNGGALPLLPKPELSLKKTL